MERPMRYRESTLKTLLAVVAVATASQALAQQQSITNNETFKGMIGKWEISNADRDRTCNLTFKSDPTGSLFKLELDKACVAQMPELKDVTGWTIGGLDLVKLLDNKGKYLLEFSEGESGLFEAQSPGEVIFFMQTAPAAAGGAGISQEQMAGDWGVV